MPTKFSVLKIANDKIISIAKADVRNYSVFHPSEWEGCKRKVAYHYYTAAGFIKVDQAAIKIDARGQRIFDNGHWMHERWRSYLDVDGVLLGKWMCENFHAHQTPKIYGENNTTGITRPEKCECGFSKFRYVELGYFDEETNWGGHIDAILNTFQEDYPPKIVVDFKSINPRDFSDLTEPKSSHKTQMQIYLYLSKLPMGKFIYENKANQAVKEFDVMRDDAFINVKKEEAILLKHRVTHRNSKGQLVLPPRAYLSKGHKECMGCRFRGHCWK